MSSLTQQEAATRAATVTVHGYELDVDLTGGTETFRSTTTIRFSTAEDDAQTFVELRPVSASRAVT